MIMTLDMEVNWPSFANFFMPKPQNLPVTHNLQEFISSYRFFCSRQWWSITAGLIIQAQIPIRIRILVWNFIALCDFSQGEVTPCQIVKLVIKKFWVRITRKGLQEFFSSYQFFLRSWQWCQITVGLIIRSQIPIRIGILGRG